MLFVNLNAKMGIHQSALADEMYKILGAKFVFIEFGGNQDQYGSFKVQESNEFRDRPYILRMWESNENEKRGLELIEKADAIRTGGKSFELVKSRLQNKKLTFRSSERIFKTPLWKAPTLGLSLYHSFMKLSNSNYRFLCQSAYLSNDLYPFVDVKKKCYKFAYYTQFPQLSIEELMRCKKHDKIQMVWCARFIDWKHPEMAIQLAEKLIYSGRSNFEIIMIGANTTPLWKEIKQIIENKGLQNHVKLTGGIPNNEVLETMRKSNIFLFTSDRNEGWGAVLNEAMGAGCACVASHEIGSVPFLLKDKVNGLIYRSCSLDSLFEKVSALYDNPSLCELYGKEALHTITTDWSAKVASERLVQLSESILCGKEIVFQDGPCSKAYPTKARKLLI